MVLNHHVCRAAAALLGLLFLSGPMVARAQVTEPSYPDADELMYSVLQQLPAQPLGVKGRLTSKNRSGEISKILFVEMELRWGDVSPTAVYSIRDRFGEFSDEIKFEWDDKGRISHAYRTPESPMGDDQIDLFSKISETDITWSDLSFSFLWWSGGSVIGAEQKKGRFCYIVELPVPGSQDSRVRLWIDPEVYVLLQAEFDDKNGTLVRRMSVRSFKKINEIWTIKDLDVYSYPSRRKTTLRIEEIETLTNPQ